MTIGEFFRRLPKDGWTLDEKKRVRRADTCQCPIEYVAGVCTGAWPIATVTLERTICRSVLVGITLVADHAGYNPDLRAQLLDACGLTE